MQTSPKKYTTKISWVYLLDKTDIHRERDKFESVATFWNEILKNIHHHTLKRHREQLKFNSTKNKYHLTASSESFYNKLIYYEQSRLETSR